jgi:hypothetical protein
MQPSFMTSSFILQNWSCRCKVLFTCSGYCCKRQLQDNDWKRGFGHVYYGKLEDGQEAAIKVLDVKSTQRPSKFFNEVCKISRLFWDVHNEISSTWLWEQKFQPI